MPQLGELANALLSPSPLGLAIGIVLVLTIPLFLHFFVFRASGLTTLPSILLIGPSGSGKTSLLTLVSKVEPHIKLTTDYFAV
jgi:signal recognition particle receptor subunit beta